MKRELIKEAFRLQTLAGIKAVNEIGKDYDGDKNTVTNLPDGNYFAVDGDWEETYKGKNGLFFTLKGHDLIGSDGEKFRTSPEEFLSQFTPDEILKVGSLMEVKKAKKDHDNDGEVETPKEEYFGSRDKAIKASRGVKECAECEEEMGIKDFVRGEDHEGYMAHSELKSLQSNASRLMNIIGDDNAELPGWVSTYISLAADYMNSVTDYLSAKEPEQEEEQNY